jgi:hypothetical protein
MRLWTLHPKYLDPQGLVALWREGLLAQAVLNGLTRGYTRHPQLIRFHQSPDSEAAIARYLMFVCEEAGRRGYRFDSSKIPETGLAGQITVPEGQIDYEWAHLLAKLRVRSPQWADVIHVQSAPEIHPLFKRVPGGVADWEVMPSKLSR